MIALDEEWEQWLRNIREIVHGGKGVGAELNTLLKYPKSSNA